MNSNELLKSLKAEVEKEYLNNIEPFWYRYSMDRQNSGFYGQVKFDNSPIPVANKGAILNARILWSFSAAHKQFKTKKSAELAHRAYQYLINHFLDREYSGIYWMVDQFGEVYDDRKHVYVQAFAIYGLVEYYSIFGVEEALDISIQLFNAIERNCKDDEFGGYFEAYSRDWKPIDDVRLSEKDKNEPKSMNTHLHVLEGYTSLYKYNKNIKVANAIDDLLSIFEAQILNKQKDSLICFFTSNWEQKSDRISYGHDIEASWLCTEAAKVLDNAGWITVFNNIALKIADKVIGGTDENGGIINEFTPTTVIDSDKDWWPQAEALVGHLNAFQISENRHYLLAALKSWRFIKEYIIDHNYGEWYEKVDRKGNPYNQLDKIRSWKAPYHNSRAMIEVSRRVNQILNPQKIEETSASA